MTTPNTHPLSEELRIRAHLTNNEKYANAADALDALKHENARLREALEQIGRMHTTPDDKINRFTLLSASTIARNALNDLPVEMKPGVNANHVKQQHNQEQHCNSDDDLSEGGGHGDKS